MAEDLAKTLASVKIDQAKNLHFLELLRIHTFITRQEHQAALAEMGHENDPNHAARLLLTEQRVIPHLLGEIKRAEGRAERWKARVNQIQALLDWELKTCAEEDAELQPIQEPVYFV